MHDDADLPGPIPLADDGGPTSAYRIRSEATWALARDAYLAGETAESVCARFDLGITTFRERARTGGWRRCDRPDPGPLPVGPEDDIDFDATYADLADHAMRQLRRAMARGQASAAASWMRLHDRLTARARDADTAQRQAAAVAARPHSVATERVRERVEARRLAAQAHVARRDGADAIGMASRIALGVEQIARRVAAADPRDGVARAAIDAELARLEAEIRGCGPPIPDDPDNPDPFFTTDPDDGETLETVREKA